MSHRLPHFGRPTRRTFPDPWETMHPHRPLRKTVVLAMAGVAPVAALLTGAAASTAEQAAAPAVVQAAHVQPQPEPAQAPAPTTQVQVRKVALTRPVAPPRVPASVSKGLVPRVNFDAYRSAEASMAKSTPRCHIDWKLIAGIGRVESHHANLGDTFRNGKLRTPIYGPTLDGSLAGNRVVSDTDGGRLDGDSTYDRAVGPMQFLPSTWEHYAADGNGDGKKDPQNLFDAALTTARYLCEDRVDMRKTGDRVTAILRYNNSMEYVDDVLGFARSY